MGDRRTSSLDELWLEDCPDVNWTGGGVGGLAGVEMDFSGSGAGICFGGFTSPSPLPVELLAPLEVEGETELETGVDKVRDGAGDFP